MNAFYEIVPFVGRHRSASFNSFFDFDAAIFEPVHEQHNFFITDEILEYLIGNSQRVQKAKRAQYILVCCQVYIDTHPVGLL
jgi:hypothetical protein